MYVCVGKFSEADRKYLRNKYDVNAVFGVVKMLRGIKSGFKCLKL